jgi:hypothetical protein
MQAFSGTSTPEYQLQYMSSEVRSILNGLENQFIEFLTSDLIKREMPFELKNWLIIPYYQSSNENAKDCLEICPTVDHIWGRKIKGWTDSALKCYDNFLLKYIQVDQQETIARTSDVIKESDVYKHLVNKGGIEQEIGQNFIYIYQLRSAFHHIQLEEIDGIRTPKRLSNNFCNKQRDLIVSLFRSSINQLFENITISNS